MKKRFFALSLIFVIASLLFYTVAFASDIPDEAAGIAITVVVPRTGSSGDNVPAPQPEINHVYPVHVWESREDGRREIIRVYELRDDENPAHIRRDSFERDGFLFELAEVVRREIPTHSTRDHVETVELSTQSNDLATIIGLLSPTLDYLTEEGYFGVLALDVSSIQIASQGTRSSSFNATRTREFPHLSTTDTSLVPRTITENGRTYSLENVEWRTQSATAIDYRQVPTTFTAVATFSRVGTRVSTIGYTTTVQYRGQISRISVGRTEFTAHFIGIPIVTPTMNMIQYCSKETDIDTANVDNKVPEHLPAISETEPTESTAIDTVTVEHVHIGGIVIEAEHIIPPPQVIEYDNPIVEDIQESDSSGFPFGYIVFALIFIASVTFAYFLGKKGIAMLGAMRKASYILLAFGMMISVSQTIYAVELPRYGFGTQNNESTVHFNTSVQEQSNNHTAMHFHPSVVNNGARASPMTISVPGSRYAYNYGDIIGVLTIERLGRRINVIAGATMESMDFGGGHFSFTGLNQGNTGIIGHNRGRNNGFFDFVRHLREGDILTLEAGGITRRYAVSMLYIIDDTDFSPLMQFGDNRISLITCVEYQRNQRRVAVGFAID